MLFRSIQEFLTNPVLSSKDKSAGIEALLKKASPKGHSEISKNFFEVLAENGRLYEAEKVMADFLEIMSAHRGEVKVTITTAQPLEKDLQKRIEESLKGSALAGAGKTLIIENKVSEAILGGLVVDMGDGRTLDLSVASKVNKLNASLQGAFFCYSLLSESTADHLSSRSFSSPSPPFAVLLPSSTSTSSLPSATRYATTLLLVDSHSSPSTPTPLFAFAVRRADLNARDAPKAGARDGREGRSTWGRRARVTKSRQVSLRLEVGLSVPASVVRISRCCALLLPARPCFLRRVASRYPRAGALVL